jgi:hypothetical protein
MGATIADAVLQAGISYETVVRPRVDRLIASYPEAKTTSVLAQLVADKGASEVLQWRSGRKLETFAALIDLFLENKIENEDELRAWLERPDNIQRLKRIKGIKDKSANYLQILVGTQNVAVDRHLFRFLAEAGLPTTVYSEAHQLIHDASIVLGVEPSILDHSIWRFMSRRGLAENTKPCADV